MPLLKRREWMKITSPTDMKASDEVFVVRFTGEVFRDYDSYLTAMHKYMSRQWQCKFTGKSNLTFLEALEEERKSAELLKEVKYDLNGWMGKLEHVCHPCKPSTGYVVSFGHGGVLHSICTPQHLQIGGFDHIHSRQAQARERE
jgi:hypothetical protein